MKIQVVILALIAVLLIVTVFFAFFEADMEADNRKVMTDVETIGRALQIYHDENGFYPPNSEVNSGFSDYLSFWPTPATANDCQIFPMYRYTQKNGGDNYTLEFCLTAEVQNLNRGLHVLTERGIN